jgi:diaminopimelate epimerase
LLLETQGRVQGHTIILESPTNQRKFEFFDGLQAEAVGNDVRAAAIFKEAMFARKDSLMAMAGRNELAAIRTRLLTVQMGAGGRH